MSVQTPRKKTAKKTSAKTSAKKCVATKVIKVDPRVMRQAKMIKGGGKYTQIEIIDAGTVVVR